MSRTLRAPSAGKSSGHVAAANRRRNDLLAPGRRARWAVARDALWEVLDPLVARGARVLVVGAGNGDDLPLRRLASRAGAVDLVDIDTTAIRRARKRVRRARYEVRAHALDVTFGAADAIVAAALRRQRSGPARDRARPTAGRYDVVVGDLIYTQLLYPALADAGLSGSVIDGVLLEHGQKLTTDVVDWLHAQAPEGVVVHVHDVLGWWPGHRQPFAIDEFLALAARDPQSAAARIGGGNTAYGCDPALACRDLGIRIERTTYWQWPFTQDTDYLIAASTCFPGTC